MAIYRGNNKIDEVFYGVSKMKEVYKGDQLLYRSTNDLILFDENKVNVGFNISSKNVYAYMDEYDLALNDLNSLSFYSKNQFRTTGTLLKAITKSKYSVSGINMSPYNRIKVISSLSYGATSGLHVLLELSDNAYNNIVSEFIIKGAHSRRETILDIPNINPYVDYHVSVFALNHNSGGELLVNIHHLSLLR